MEYAGSRRESDCSAKYFLYRRAEHGLYHFRNGVDLTPGLPPND